MLLALRVYAKLLEVPAFYKRAVLIDRVLPLFFAELDHMEDADEYLEARSALDAPRLPAGLTPAHRFHRSRVAHPAHHRGLGHGDDFSRFDHDDEGAGNDECREEYDGEDAQY